MALNEISNKISEEQTGSEDRVVMGVTTTCVRLLSGAERFASHSLPQCSRDLKAGSTAVPIAPCETIRDYPPFLSASLAGSGSPWLLGSLTDL